RRFIPDRIGHWRSPFSKRIRAGEDTTKKALILNNQSLFHSHFMYVFSTDKPRAYKVLVLRPQYKQLVLGKVHLVRRLYAVNVGEPPFHPDVWVRCKPCFRTARYLSKAPIVLRSDW